MGGGASKPEVSDTGPSGPRSTTLQPGMIFLKLQQSLEDRDHLPTTLRPNNLEELHPLHLSILTVFE